MSILKSRRAFLESSGFSAAAMAGSSWLSAARAAERDATPDLIVINAKVTTMDAGQPRAEAFAVKADRFAAVGSTTDMKSLAGPRTRIYDAKGMMITPGFIDTHNHGGGNILLYEVLVGNPYVVEYVTIQSIIDKLKARAATTPPGYWVQGFYFDDAKVKDNRPLTNKDLDKVSTVHPVVVRHRGGHTSYYNSKAMDMAGLTKNTPPHFGGTFDKDARGELNGRVTDRARDIFKGVGKYVTYSPDETHRRAVAGVEFISKKFVEYGLTSVCHDENALEAMQTVRQNGKLMHRISFEPMGDVLEAMIRTGIKTDFGDEWIKFGATTEHGVDGSFSERTAALSRPYIGISPPYTGNVTERQEDTNAWAERVHRAGIRVNVHANGDVAIAQSLTAFERMLKVYPVANSRPKITHCTFVNDDIIRRMKAIDAVGALFSTYAYYNSDKFHYYGTDFMAHAMAYKTMADAGVNASTGSDFGTPGPFAPMMAIQGMVTRKGFNGETWGANQKLTVDQAIKAATLNGAYDTREEHLKGSITPGKLADFVVLADDLHAIDPEKIKDVQIVQTVVGGVVRHQA
ncbi:MAG TPA: amidohydrolase [Rhizomicrobium sp.]|nr:amidohydrolase [Rhizomicrobium sp.]